MGIEVSTKTKLRIARGLHTGARLINRFRGRSSNKVVCRRGGFFWSLDIAEGIDLSIFLFGCFEKSTAKVISRLIKPGMIVLDIGANIGAHTLPMAKHVGPTGRVYAVEPTDFAFTKLTRNLKLNPEIASRVVPVNAAFVSDAGQELGNIYASWQVVGGEDIHAVHGGTVCETGNARRVRLDDFVSENGIEKVSLIKLDVDGFEYHVLKGAERILRRDKPVIVMELAPYVHKEHGATFAGVVDILLDAGYQFKREGTGELLPRDARLIEELIPVGGCINIIAEAVS